MLYNITYIRNTDFVCIIIMFHSLSQFVCESNWYSLFGVSKKHSLSRLKSEIRRFVGSNLDAVSDQISFKVKFNIMQIIPTSASLTVNK